MLCSSSDRKLAPAVTQSGATQSLQAADSLRTAETAHLPDERTASLGFPNPRTLADQHALMAALHLVPEVPEKVAIAFETARNLYLYAWHVFRFYPVAQMQALAALEMGLKTRLPARLPERYQRPSQKQPTLHGLLGYAIDQGLLKNEGFNRWHAAAENKARQRRDWDAMRHLVDEGLDVVEVDDNEPVEITPEDQTWDLLAVLRDGLHRVRNELAHGSSMLSHQVRGDIELVAEMLNQLYAPAPATASP